jgi:flagellar hook-basal body complex protein FliE
MSNVIAGIGGMRPASIAGVQGGDAPRRTMVDIGKGEGASFGDTLTRVLNEVSATQDKASDAIERFVRGEPVELHQVMAATEEAGIALEMLVELRNKLTDAYRTLINMQS